MAHVDLAALATVGEVMEEDSATQKGDGMGCSGTIIRL